MNDNFYREFEDEFRGSRESIKSRLNVYSPFLNAISQIYPKSNTLDIGCGRGEWLELLSEHNLIGRGVDLDKGMLESCIKRNLDVICGDGIELLSGLEDNSLSVISAFHVVEHISFEQKLTLIKEAHRVLKPGGILILETPNPENISVGTTSFYLDPTHEKPIPHQLLEFLPKYCEFSKVKLIRLQEAKDLNENSNIGIMNVLTSVSPDYSVVSQKYTDNQDVGKFFDELFNQEYGLSLGKIASWYDKKISFEINDIKSRLSDISSDNLRLHNELIAVYRSGSWKLTAPIRTLIGYIKLLSRK
nr:class I SAM-dependent methyltransferase [uncultured Tolumonas sp.]